MPIEYRAALLALAMIGAALALTAGRKHRRARMAEGEALVDPLTGLPNRRAFERQLQVEWHRSMRYNRPLGLVMLDLDASRLRATDLPARLGGDEFVAPCPETFPPGLDTLAHSLEGCLDHLSVGASVGFAVRRPDDQSPADLLARADAEMYRNKRSTRRQLVPVA